MKRILLTGTSGQVGGALQSALRSDAAILAQARSELDLSVPSSIASTLDRMQPELIINAAAYTAVDRAEDEADLAFPPHGPLLCELSVVRVGWRATADQARLRSHEFKMFAITLAYWFADDNHRLSAWFAPR